jgi:hypothetical protein
MSEENELERDSESREDEWIYTALSYKRDNYAAGQIDEFTEKNPCIQGLSYQPSSIVHWSSLNRSKSRSVLDAALIPRERWSSYTDRRVPRQLDRQRGVLAKSTIESSQDKYTSL